MPEHQVGQTLVTQEYITECRHPAIQGLKPQLAVSDLVWTPDDRLIFMKEADSAEVNRSALIWLPTLDQLLSMLCERSHHPNEPILRPSEEGWECVITISEWTEDYGTFVDVQRRFVGNSLKLVVLRAIKAAIGTGARWMVGG